VLAVHAEVVDLGAEGRGDLRGGARELDEHPARGHAVDAEAAGAEPAGDGVDVRLGDAVRVGEGFGREPLLVARRGLVVERLGVVRECGLLSGGSLEAELGVLEELFGVAGPMLFSASARGWVLPSSVVSLVSSIAATLIRPSGSVGTAPGPAQPAATM